jgi:hypothetical protein
MCGACKSDQSKGGFYICLVGGTKSVKVTKVRNKDDPYVTSMARYGLCPYSLSVVRFIIRGSQEVKAAESEVETQRT